MLHKVDDVCNSALVNELQKVSINLCNKLLCKRHLIRQFASLLAAAAGRKKKLPIFYVGKT